MQLCSGTRNCLIFSIVLPHDTLVLMDTIVFAGGGTGGHIFPGLAILEIITEKYPHIQCIWFGSSTGMDRNLVESAGVRFYGIPSGKMRRYASFRNFLDLFKIMAGFFVSLYHLMRIRPSIVFSKGGFVSVPPCFAAALLRIPIITHECDVTPGLATRLNSLVAKQILVSYEKTVAFFSSGQRRKIIVSGNPVRRVFYHGNASSGLIFCGFEQRKLPVVFVQGGSLGARQINSLILDCAPVLLDFCCIVHQTGAGNREEALLFEQSNTNGNYRSFEFIREEMPHVLAFADLVISRAGANSVWECAAAGKPMILIPLEGGSSRGDQIDNARFFEEKGAAIVLGGDMATGDNLIDTVKTLLADQETLSSMADASRSLGSVNAAQSIADTIIGTIRPEVAAL